MRLALVVERFVSSGGGGEQVAWNVARELVQAGDEVDVFCRSGTDAPGLSIRRLSTPAFWQPVRVRAFARNVRRAISAGGYDAVHSFSRTLDQDVIHLGGGSHADYMEKTYGPRGARMRRWSPRHQTLLSLERRIFENPRLIGQCVSGMVQREIASRYGVPEARLPVIHCGVDVKRFAPERQGDARLVVRQEFSAENDTVWLFAGSGWRRKGLDLAIAALANTSNPATQLWVAGKDHPTSWKELAAKRSVADRVRFLGERTDLERCYAAADGLLLPSRYDAFGLVCLEAAAAGLPVLTNRNVGAAELFEHCGRVLPGSADASDYAREMESLSSARGRSELGQRALDMAAKHDWQHHVAKLRALYEGVSR